MAKGKVKRSSKCRWMRIYSSVSTPWRDCRGKSCSVSKTVKSFEAKDARKMDLCHKVEAINTLGQVIPLYQPMCVPKLTKENSYLIPADTGEVWGKPGSRLIA
jgi:hypothetical protein